MYNFIIQKSYLRNKHQNVSKSTQLNTTVSNPIVQMSLQYKGTL
jgi:hypothetical protein